MYIEDRYIYEKFPNGKGWYEWCEIPLNIDSPYYAPSPLINLQADEDVILSSFKATVRNEIRRCEKDDAPILNLNTNPSKIDIELLLQKYEEFAKSKGLENILEQNINHYRNYLEILAKNNCLVIATATTDNNENCRVTDALFMKKECGYSRLNVSVSNFRYQDKEIQKINSRLNKWLKYQECKFFKSSGIKYFDLGGAPKDKVEDEQINMVRDFKLSFSNNFACFYNFEILKKRSWWYNFRHNIKNSTQKSKQPRICLLFDKKVDDHAYEIVNQLAYCYCFDIKLFNNYNKNNSYDLVHIADKNIFDKDIGNIKIIKQDFRSDNIGFNPFQYFYARNRLGELQILNQSDYSTDFIANAKFEQYNNFDVYVCTKNDISLVYAMACGCFPICQISDLSKQIIRHKQNGFILENNTEDELKAAISWCNDHTNFIRRESIQIAKDIYNSHRWEIVSQRYKELYDNSINNEKSSDN